MSSKDYGCLLRCQTAHWVTFQYYMLAGFKLPIFQSEFEAILGYSRDFTP